MTAKELLEKLKPYLKKVDMSGYNEYYQVDPDFSIRLCYHASPPGYISTIIRRKQVFNTYSGSIAFVVNGSDLRVFEDKECNFSIEVSKFTPIEFQ